jgi:hypothetical protein
MSTLIKIDELSISKQQHWALSLSDECYYLFEYKAHHKASYIRGNDLIWNLKKAMDRKGRPEWHWKESAIGEVAAALRTTLPHLIDFGDTTLIPIPPSKTKANPLYDDRNLRILQMACPAGADIRELIVTKKDTAAAHEREDRPSIGEIMENYALHQGVPSDLKRNVVLFDDVITAGNHYIACKQFVERHCGPKKICGVFIARRVIHYP